MQDQKPAVAAAVLVRVLWDLIRTTNKNGKAAVAARNTPVALRDHAAVVSLPWASHLPAEKRRMIVSHAVVPVQDGPAVALNGTTPVVAPDQYLHFLGLLQDIALVLIQSLHPVQDHEAVVIVHVVDQNTRVALPGYQEAPGVHIVALDIHVAVLNDQEVVRGARTVDQAIQGVQEAVQGAQGAVRGVQEVVRGVQEAVRDVQEAVRGVQEAVQDAREAVQDIQGAV